MFEECCWGGMNASAAAGVRNETINVMFIESH